MKKLILTSIFASGLSLSVLADDTDTMYNTSFDDLSGGEQSIARSLFDAQTIPDDGSVEPWTLDDISAARSETGWGNVFKKMQAEGLIESKNLGQVVSAYSKNNHIVVDEETAMAAGMTYKGKHKKEDESDIASNEGESVDNVETGAFDKMSPGNQKIARSLMDAQKISPDSTSEPWTLDQIASAKGQTGWGNVQKQMQAEGLVDSKNLGQIISSYDKHNATYISADSASTAGALATTADVKSNGKAKAASVSSASVQTSSGNGNAYGLNKKVSAADGVVSANGTVHGSNSLAQNGANSSSNSSHNSIKAATSSASSSTVTTGVGSGNGNGNAFGHSKK